MSNLSDVMTRPLQVPDIIPDDWVWKNLVDVCQPTQWKTISGSKLTATGYPVFGANGFIGFYPEYNHESETIVITCRGATCGTVSLVPPKTYITGNAMCLDNTSKDLSQHYLLYATQYRTLSDVISGSAQPQITREGLRKVELPFPPLRVQKKIASILTSVDDVIEKTEAQIAKLQDLKTGMMNELLTNGIGHTEFKDSELGRIPKSWEVVSLGDLTVESAFGPRFSSDLYSEDGKIGCIRTTDIDKNWNINYDTVPTANLSAEEFRSHILKSGDMLVTRSGTCGLVDIFKEQRIPIIAGAFLIRFRLKKNIDPLFLRLVMMDVKMQERVQGLASGGVQKNLSGTNLKSLPIIRPELDEQRRIISSVESITIGMARLSEKLKHTQSLKKSLMQDLLTGKVRVEAA